MDDGAFFVPEMDITIRKVGFYPAEDHNVVIRWSAFWLEPMLPLLR